MKWFWFGFFENYLNILLFNAFDRLLTAFIAEYIYNGSKPL